MGKIKAQYAQKFRKEWLNMSDLKDWVIAVPSDDTVAYCKYCSCTLAAKLDSLQKHMSTNKHQENAEPFSSKRQTKLGFPTEPKPKPSLKDAQAEAAMCLFVACHTSILSVDHLGEVCNNMLKGHCASGQIKCHRTKCTGIIKNVIYPHFKDDLREDIGDSPYSVITDESTDIASVKQLGMCIIYHSKSLGKIVTTHLNLTSLDGGTADCIVKGMKAGLNDYGLDLAKMEGIGVDNANVNVGTSNGVYQKLKREIPHLVLSKCICHSIQLAVSSAVKAHMPRHVEYLVSGTYNWFSGSSKRQAEYATLYKAINDDKDPLKILEVADTRWLSIEPAVRRILSQWSELELHFRLAKDKEKCYNAELLYNMYSDPMNKLYLEFIFPILEECQKVNKAFESNSADQTKLLQDLVLLISSLGQRVIQPGYSGELMNADIFRNLASKPNLGSVVEKRLSELLNLRKIDEAGQVNFVERGKMFIAALFSQLQQRLPENVETLQKVSMFSPKNCLTPFKQSIVPIAELKLCSPAAIAKAEVQWGKLHLTEWQSVDKTADFWIEVDSYKDACGENPFRELADLALRVLVLPWSNAEVERLFSMMNLVKSKLRNRLSNTATNAILTVRYGLKRRNICCYQYSFPEAVLCKIGTLAAYDRKKSTDTPSLPFQEHFHLEMFVEEEEDNAAAVPEVHLPD